MIFDKLYKSENDVLNLVDKNLKSKSSLVLTYMNQHCFNIYNANSEYKNLLDGKFEIYLDGVGIFFVLKLFGNKNVQRFNATDLNEKIFTRFSEHAARLFIIGGEFEKKFIYEKATQKKINVVGYQNGFFNNGDFHSLIEKIKNSSPQAIIVAMGVPKQEIIAQHLNQAIDSALIICVGYFLEFYFGTKKRAPKIIRYLGFEWLFRLITEPTRLRRRYLIGIPLFLYNILKMRLDSAK